MYHPDTIWLGTEAGMLWLDTKSHAYAGADHKHLDPRFSGFNVLSYTYRGQRAWVGRHMREVFAEYDLTTRKAQVFDLTTDPPIPFTRVKSIVYDHKGDAWLGGHALARFNHHTRNFDTLITAYAGPNKYNDDILCMQADDAGSLWIHNAGNALLQFQIDSKTWRHFGFSEGIPSESMETMSQVIDGKLWIATSNQLLRFDTKTFACEIFGSPDGYPDVETTSRHMYFDSVDRQLYVFMGNDVLAIPIDSVPADSVKRTVLFEQIRIHDGPVIHFPQQHVVLPSRHNNLFIPFTVIDHLNSGQYRFAYRMRDNIEWIELENRRSIDLIRLAPGDYRLEVRVSPLKGKPFTGTLDFSINPPWWRSPLVLAGYVIAFILLLYLLYRWRIARIRAKANIDKRLSQTEMKALHAQMNPHFVFNSLNSIREMILGNENMEASRYLGNFAHLIRMTLHQSRQNTITLRETMDYLQRYVQMEQIRNADFTFQMDAGENVDPDQTVLPPMLIQPFVENAIWHGMNGEESHITIIVRFARINDRLICTIEDNGVGINQTLASKNNESPSHRSVSIANIRDRMMLLNQKHNLQSTLQIEDLGEISDFHQTGTRVTLSLPFEIQDE
jgi:hypothetical protein